APTESHAPERISTRRRDREPARSTSGSMNRAHNPAQRSWRSRQDWASGSILPVPAMVDPGFDRTEIRVPQMHELDFLRLSRLVVILGDGRVEESLDV